MAAEPPQEQNPDLLRALMEEAKRCFTELLFIMEKGLQADPQREASQALAFEKQSAALQVQAQAALDNLLEAMAPWDENRKRLDVQLVSDIDHFLELLEKGLTSMAEHVTVRREDVAHRRDEVRGALEKIQKQRKGLKGYQVKTGTSKYLKDRA